MSYIELLLFFLPAGVSNMSPVLANHIPFLKEWKTPLDFGEELKGRRILGTNKTWRGLVFGTLMGGLSAVIIYSFIDSPSSLQPFWTGCLLGFGALAGDAVESFLKRWRKIKSGDSWFLFDQSDYVIGGLLAVSLVASLSFRQMLSIFFVYFTLHILVAFTGYKLGLKSKPI